MAHSQKTPLVLLLVAGLLAVGGAALFFTLSAEPALPEQASVAAPTESVAVAPAPAQPSGGPELQRPREAHELPVGDPTSTVAWPVEVSLELVRPSHMPHAKGAPPIGSGRRAGLKGVILDARAQGVAAEVTFLAGANKGRVLACNGDGEFGATDLYPGLAVVEVRGPGTPGSVREVRLRQGKTGHLNVSYSLPGSVVGTVYDTLGEPLAGVEVELDGQRGQTNEAGEFHYTSITAGLNLVLVLRKPGYAHFGGVLAIPAGRHVAKGRYKFAMDRGSRLTITIADRLGGPDTTKVILLPSNTRVTRTYPWYLLNPIEVTPGGSITLESLPQTKVVLRGFHEGTMAEPAQRAATLRPGSPAQVELKFAVAPKITGRVVDAEGQPIPSAHVSIEAPDRVAATMYHLGQLPMFLETEVIPTLPPAAQETVADGAGAFVFSAWGAISPVRYIVAESPDGSLWGSAIVRPSAEDSVVEVELRPITEGRAELRVNFQGRHQAVPVEVVVNGAPREPVLVPVEDVLHIEDLAEGTWRMLVSWNGEPVFGRDGYDEFELGARGELRDVQLPQGAIDGQDEDTLLRAGKL